jgi:beta-lactam-binding protein with PASTA domain
VPDVVGMGAKAACRALGREGYSGGVFGEVEASGVQPGRVVEQDPGAGFVGGEGQLVHLFVSAPFRDDLPPSHPCVERRDGS